MNEYLVSLSIYNTWANSKISNFIAEAGEARCLLIQQSSFSAIHDTVMHILNAQKIWYSRIHIESPIWTPGRFDGTTAEACVELIENSRLFEKYIAQLELPDISRVINYKNIKGDSFQNTIGETMTHLMNHGTFHRGQLVTMLRGAGFTNLTSTDMITFYREQVK